MPAEPEVPTSFAIRLFRAAVVIIASAALAWFVWGNATNPESDRPFKLGLDLAGGSHLVYEADVSNINPLEVPDLMDSLRTVIERRVNSLGTEENSVYIEQSSIVSDVQSYRLVIELPGVTDVAAAVAEIGRTPLLEFKLIDQALAAAEQAAFIESLTATTATSTVDEDGNLAITVPELSSYQDTGLTGRYLESAALEFAGGQSGQLANEPIVSIRFTPEGAELFANITRANVGEQLAIFLDGQVISAPRINEAITGGTAIISGGFNPVEARELAQNLNLGALPVPIELVNTQTIGATLGADVLDRGINAALFGFTLVALFMIGWYRIPGAVAVVALLTYLVMMLALFQVIPVTLTAAGLAGFVLSIGIAVDANVLVFERMKEEIRAGQTTAAAAKAGFARAWSAIRDGNITSILSAIVLFWFGTSMVKGFALVFGIGVIMSMFSALVVTRTLLRALPDVAPTSTLGRYGFSTGLTTTTVTNQPSNQ